MVYAGEVEVLADVEFEFASVLVDCAVDSCVCAVVELD